MPKLVPWMWTVVAVAVGLVLIFWPRRVGTTIHNMEPWQRSGYALARIHEAVYTALSWPYLLMIALTVNYLVRQDALSQTAMFGSWANVFVRRNTPVAIAAFGKNEVGGPGVPRRVDAEPAEFIVHAPGVDPTEPDPTEVT